MKNHRKFFVLVLHSHIPYVLGHGGWPHGTDWLYEAAAESYIPLLDVFERLVAEGLSPSVNISFTPVLMDQLKDKGFASGFSQFLKMKIGIVREDRVHFQRTGRQHVIPLTDFWENWYLGIFRSFKETHQEDILASFSRLQEEGHIEILTSSATHCYFPLVSRDETLFQQVRQGKHVYKRIMGREPKGFWIPECAYRPGYLWSPPFGGKKPYPRLGVDEILSRENLGYFFVDAHLLKGGQSLGVYAERFPALMRLWSRSRNCLSARPERSKSPYLPYYAHPSHMPFLVRDQISGTQVWSRRSGYPGDGHYLEFHKKHFPGGMRYWRITAAEADLADKDYYHPRKVVARIEENAGHFVRTLENILEKQEAGVVVSLYDTELLGHWWFEGPEWLYHVLKRMAKSALIPMTASQSIERIPPEEMISLPEGSWGEGGFHWIWLNEDTSWIWEKIYEIEAEFSKMDKETPSIDKRLFDQFIREKYLLESSDWPFLISTWSARDYAESRAAEHYERARTLANWLKRQGPLSNEEKNLLAAWEKEDRLFEEIIHGDGTQAE